MEHLPLILIEVVLVFGGALAFAWWQLRDLAQERKKRDAAKAAASNMAHPIPEAKPDVNGSGSGSGHGRGETGANGVAP